jgi:hypothetical protein
MSETSNPEELFLSFEIYGQVKPMVGTYHVVELRLEDSVELLESKHNKPFQFFHDREWLKSMGYSMLFNMIHDPYPIFGFAGINTISTLYKTVSFERLGTEVVSMAASNAASFLGAHLSIPIKFSGKLLEFPDSKILSAYFVWKQKMNRKLLIQSLTLTGLLSQGESIESASEKVMNTMDEKAKLKFIAEYLKFEKVPGWQLNGLSSYWSKDENKIRLKLHQELPIGTDFLNFLMDIFGRTKG